MARTRSDEELERLAEATAEADLEADLGGYIELIKPLTKPDLLKLAEIHRRRAVELTEKT